MSHLITPRPGAMLGGFSAGRASVLLSAACVVVHAVLLAAASSATGAFLGLTMLYASAWCLSCGWTLWRRPSRAAWRRVAVISLVVLALHLVMVLAMLTSGAGHSMVMTPVTLHEGPLHQAHSGSDATLAPGRMGVVDVLLMPAMLLGLGLTVVQLTLAVTLSNRDRSEHPA